MSERIEHGWVRIGDKVFEVTSVHEADDAEPIEYVTPAESQLPDEPREFYNYNPN